MEAYWWLLIFAALIIMEMITMGLTTVWFAGGALAAFVFALIGVSFKVQLVIFLAVSLVLLILVRPFAAKSMQGHVTKTNAESLIGQKARVTEEIRNLEGTGTAVVNGQEWTARSEDDTIVIPAGEMAVITAISGVKLIVRKEN